MFNHDGNLVGALQVILLHIENIQRLSQIPAPEQKYATQARQHVGIAISLLQEMKDDDAAAKDEFARILVRLCFQAGAHEDIPEPQSYSSGLSTWRN
jgi:hypothetical protein